MPPNSSSTRIVNLPNALTALRLALVPVFVVVFFLDGGHDTAARWYAGIIFAIAAITDRYDGHLARIRGQVTTFGKLADPIADKTLVGAALICLSLIGDLPWWITVVILVREIGITLLRFLVLSNRVIAASRGGKAKTLAQIVGIGLYILPLDALGLPLVGVEWTRMVVMGVAIALTVITGIEYLIHAMRHEPTSPAQQS